MAKRWYVEMERRTIRKVLVEAETEEEAKEKAADGHGELDEDDDEGYWRPFHAEEVTEG